MKKTTAKKADATPHDYTLGATSSISVENFFNTNLKLYSAHSNVRGLPFIGDGFNEAQRKAIWGMIARGENKGSDTVERISAAAASDTDYHHGIGSLQGTFVGLAQNFAGSNNYNLLSPDGQFGSRLDKNASAPRYIKTKLEDNFRKLFKKEDDAIMEFNYSNGVKIEPKFFIPVLPTVLINGAQGIGTGHAATILSYNPDDIKAAVIKVLDGKKLAKNTLVPWFRGFTGDVERNPDNGQITIRGKLHVVNSTNIKITELPVGFESDKYEALLFKLSDSGIINDFDFQYEDGYDINVKVPRTTTALPEAELYKHFKLEKKDTENFTVWGADGFIKKFECAEDLLEEFVGWRTKLYNVRLANQIAQTTEAIDWSSMKIRFINFYLKNTKLFKDTGKKELIALLLENDFPEYDRLLGMNLWSLTRDRIAELEKELDELKAKLISLKSDTAEALYKRELKEFKYDPTPPKSTDAD